MLCVLLICAFLALVRCLPFLAQHKDKEKYAMYAMKIPVVLLVDVWYRGCMNSACGPVLRWLIDNGWWNESQWPTSHLDYFRYLLVPVSIFLLTADTCHLPAIFSDTISDSLTVAVLFAASQKFFGNQDEQNQILPGQLSCRKPSYHSLMLIGHIDRALSELLTCPSEWSEMDHIDEAETTLEKTCEWSSDLIEAVATFLVAVVVHSHTSLIIKSQPTRRDQVMDMAVFFLVAPLLYVAGVRWWLISWINWLICNLCALAAIGVSLKRSCKAAVTLWKYFDNFNTVVLKAKGMAPSFFAFIYLRSFLLVSYLSYIILSLIVTLWNNISSQTKWSENSLSSLLTLSTASPIAFYCFCLVSSFVYTFIMQVFAVFLAQRLQGLGQITPTQHMHLTRFMFDHGVWCFLVDLPVWMSPIIPFISLTPFALWRVLLYANNSTEIMRNHWYYIRAKCVYFVIFMLPPVSIIIIWSYYGHTSPLFISALPSLYLCFQLSGEFIQHVVWAMENWPNQPFQYNARELCSIIKRGTEYATMMFHCGVAVFCVYVCLFVEWAWNTLPLICKLLFVALGQYLRIRTADQLKRELTDMINSLPLPENDDERLIDDVCPICLTPMDRIDSRKTLCGHLFHSKCLISWAEIRQMCPSCQQKLVYDIKVPSDLLESGQ